MSTLRVASGARGCGLLCNMESTLRTSRGKSRTGTKRSPSWIRSLRIVSAIVLRSAEMLDNSQRDNHRAAAARLLRDYQDMGSQVHPEVRERADEEVKVSQNRSKPL